MNHEDFNKEYQTKAGQVNIALKQWLDSIQKSIDGGVDEQLRSVEYSLNSGGKRFRPVLGLAVAETLDLRSEQVMPWLLSVEMIHTYSLIHDDLPCMDNDDFRRGKPTNHKMYSEATALLSGDALLTHAFELIADSYSKTPQVGLNLVSILSKSAGLNGMIGGQVLDINAPKTITSKSDLQKMHELKTGRLICAPVEGICSISGIESTRAGLLKQFAQLLGLAFQIADDILDSDEKDQDQRSYSRYMGIDGAKKELAFVSKQALSLLEQSNCKSSFLNALIQYNIERKS